MSAHHPAESIKVEQVDQHATEQDDKILPDHYYDNGTIPVFKPTMDQFRSFPEFIKKIDHYGMQTGIIKVVPPKEWLDTLPDLDEKVLSRLNSANDRSRISASGQRSNKTLLEAAVPFDR